MLFSSPGASWRFAQVIHDEPYLAWGEQLGGLAVAATLEWLVGEHSFGSRCTCCPPSPPWACWGTGCVRPPSCAPPRPRAVGSRGRGFPQDWTVCPFLRRLSAARLPIMPHISFHFWSGRMNSAPLACDSRREKSIGTMGWCMSFVVFERKNGNFSVLQPCFGMPGGVILPMICHGSVFCLIRGCVVNYWLSAFERELELEEARGRYSVTALQLNFKRWWFSLLLCISI